MFGDIGIHHRQQTAVLSRLNGIDPFRIESALSCDNQSMATYRYDVCLSFASEDRTYVELVAAALRDSGASVFYDKYEATNLWGKNLYEHFVSVYRDQARYCVMFISRYYAAKMWTSHERRSAQERALREREEYLLPVRFDDTDVPGLLRTVGYLDAREHRPERLARVLIEKVAAARGPTDRFSGGSHDSTAPATVAEHWSTPVLMRTAAHFQTAINTAANVSAAVEGTSYVLSLPAPAIVADSMLTEFMNRLEPGDGYFGVSDITSWITNRAFEDAIVSAAARGIRIRQLIYPLPPDERLEDEEVLAVVGRLWRISQQVSTSGDDSLDIRVAAHALGRTRQIFPYFLFRHNNQSVLLEPRSSDYGAISFSRLPSLSRLTAEEAVWSEAVKIGGTSASLEAQCAVLGLSWWKEQ